MRKSFCTQTVCAHVINSVTKLDLLRKKKKVQPGGCSGLKAAGISQLMCVLIPVLAALMTYSSYVSFLFIFFYSMEILNMNVLF